MPVAEAFEELVFHFDRQRLAGHVGEGGHRHLHLSEVGQAISVYQHGNPPRQPTSLRLLALHMKGPLLGDVLTDKSGDHA